MAALEAAGGDLEIETEMTLAPRSGVEAHNIGKEPRIAQVLG